MSAVAEDEDRCLLEQARAGQEGALDVLIARHHRAVYEVAYRVLEDPESAADAAQDAFIRAIRALDTFRGEASFRTWLLRIALNAARSAGRKTSRRREVPLEAVSGTLAGTQNPEGSAVAKTEVERVERALAQLPEKQRLAVSLRIHEGLSHREIGELTGSSEGSARVNYHLGLKRLKELLK